MRTSKLNSQRPGSSARVYDYESTEHERRSKISKLPRRTCSLERKGSSYSSKRSASKLQNSATSMIPRPEWKKYCSKPFALESPPKKSNKQNNEESQPEKQEPRQTSEGKEIVYAHPSEILSLSSEEFKVNEDFLKFKNNVLRIPEYWTDAGQTVTNILKNAINIVTKQYPSADVEAFEAEIQNILKATEAVKHQILLKTEAIINQANKLYNERTDDGEPTKEELMNITKKMEDLRNEVHIRKNVFGDFIKCSNEMEQLMELEKSLNQKKVKKGNHKNNKKEIQQKTNEDINQKGTPGKKSKTVEKQVKKRGKSTSRSCGDGLRDDMKTASADDDKSKIPLQQADKSCQTTCLWNAELSRKEDFDVLNEQILALHQLCKDHISKFKSFNLQIKLRGICNKVQNHSVSKEIQILNDEKLQLAEKNNKLYFYNRDLESALKQKDLDIHQKDKLISQQKKLLHVRDELIEMLKSRCHIDDVDEM